MKIIKVKVVADMEYELQGTYTDVVNEAVNDTVRTLEDECKEVEVTCVEVSILEGSE